jgi:hypothetical protein
MAGIPRMITFRVVLFFILLLAVLAGAYALARWYAMDDWYVAVRHDHLVVYRGHPGGFLWFKPKIVEVSPVTTTEIPSFMVPDVKAEKEEPSLGAARAYVRNLHSEYLSTQPAGSSGNGASGASTTTTTASVSGSSSSSRTV